MAYEQYCIVDVTIDPHTPIEGLSGMTREAADNWIFENQVSLETPIPNMYHPESILDNKYMVQRDNWPESEE
jgi:hypothetical protein